MLPGMHNIAPAAGGTISPVFLASATSVNGNGNITMPTGIQAGDIIIVAVTADQTVSAPPVAYGTGFTAVTTSNGSYSYETSSTWHAGYWGGDPDNPVWYAGYYTYTYGTAYKRQCVSYKVATGAESGATISGFANGTTESAVVLVYRSGAAAPAVVAQGITTSTAAGTQTISASLSAAATIAVAIQTYMGAWTAFSPAADSDVVTTDIRLSALAQNPAASDVTVTSASVGFAGVFATFYLEVT